MNASFQLAGSPDPTRVFHEMGWHGRLALAARPLAPRQVGACVSRTRPGSAIERHPRFVRNWHKIFGLTHARSLALGCVLLLAATSAFAQPWELGFDFSGNLVAESAENIGPPQILAQPQMQVVVQGELASFSVLLADISGATYQWQFNGTNVANATNDNLLITGVSINNQGLYSVLVANGSGSVTSSAAPLYIDSRGCGMPDSWQLQYFGDLNQNALGDYDGDGVSNLQEFLDGTNPTNAASALYRITLFNYGGSVMILPDQPAYTNGQIVTLVAAGTNSNPFHAWTGDVTTRSNSIAVTMTSNLILFARFLPFTFVWTNTANGDWNVASSWSPNLVPGSNESVVIANQATVTENSNVDLVDFTLGVGTVGGGLTGAGTVTISGTGAWNNGTMSGGGRTAVKPGASLSIANGSGLGLSSRTLENAGTVVWAGGNFSLGGAITNDVGAQFLVFGPASFNFGGGASRFDNAGLLMASDGVTSLEVGLPFNNFGTVQIQDDTLALYGGGTDGGVINVPPGATLNLAGGVFASSGDPMITGAGNFIISGASGVLGGTVNVTGSNVFSNGSIDFTGSYILTNAPLIISGCSVSFDGASLVAPTVLTLSGGSLGGGSLVTVSSAMNWSGGSLAGTGRTFIMPGAALSINNASPIFITSRTLDNAGTVTCSGASLNMTGGVITNEPGALFQLQSPVSINFFGGAPRFDNASTGITRIADGVSFNNYGTLDIQRGFFAADGGYVSASNAVLNCTLAGTLPGTNYGQLQVSESVALNGALSINLANHYVPTTNDSFTVLKAGTRNGAFATFSYPSNEVTMQLSNTANSVVVRITGAVIPPPSPLLEIPLLSGTNVLLSWTAVSNTTYRLEFNPGLTLSNWTALPGDVLALSNTASKPDALTPSNRFYRVLALP